MFISGMRHPSFANLIPIPHYIRSVYNHTLPMASHNFEEDGFRLRSYQTEMVDASIERNIIVAVYLSTLIQSDLHS